MVTYREHIRALTVLGVPIVIGQLGTIAQGFADTIMVGQYGTPELSAAGFVNNVFNLVFFLLLGFSYSTTPIVGSYFGRRQLDDVGRTLKESLLANLMACLVVMLLMWLLYRRLDLLRQPTELMPLIRPYFLIILASLPFISAFNALKQFCDGVGDTRTPMWLMLAGNVFNILANYFLIFGFSPCHVQAMGLNGAGIATLASRVFMFVVLACVVFFSRRYVVFHNGFGKRMTRLGIFHLTKVGLPIGLQLSMEAASFNITAVMMGWLGAAALAAHQVMCTIGSLNFMFFYGIGAAATIRMSHFRGVAQAVHMPASDRADAWREVRRTAFAAFGMAVGSAVLLSAFIFLLRTPLAYCFTSSAEVVTLVVSLMVPFMLYQLGDSTQIVFSNALRAIEDVKPLVWFAFVAYVCVSIPASYLFAFPLGYGAVGIWYGFPLGLSTAGLLFLLRFHGRTR